MIKFKNIFILYSSFFNFYLKPVTISYQILCHNETESLDKLVKFLENNKNKNDEIIIVDDFSTNNETVKILNYASKIDGVKVYKKALNYNFSAQRNYADSLCSKEYIFALDADQLPSLYLIQNINKILESKADAYKVPILIIINGLSELDDRLTNRGWVNWPNYKVTIYKNSKKLKWVKPVHEYLPLNNFQQIEELPPYEKYSIIEIKTGEKTGSSNKFYFECYKKWLIRSLLHKNTKNFVRASNDIKSVYRNFIINILEDKEFIAALDKSKLYKNLINLVDKEIKNKNELFNHIKQFKELLSTKNQIYTLYNEFKNKPNIPVDIKTGNTILVHAIYYNRMDWIKELLNNGADPLLVNKNKHSALHHALHVRNKDAIHLLLKPCLMNKLKQYSLCCLENINDSINSNGHTLLMEAASHNYYDLTRLLLLNNADVLINDQQNQLALDHARAKGNNAIYELLLTRTISSLLKKENLEFYGVVTLPINENNETFLSYCAIHNKYQLAKLLIEYGSCRDVKDKYGKTPFDYVKYFYEILRNDNYKEIYELLK